VLTAGGLLSPASVQAQKTVTLTINGQSITAPTITEGGKTFVKIPLDQLKTAGALVQGGANQISGIEGCAGAYVFNGFWRVKVGTVSAVTKDGNKDGTYKGLPTVFIDIEVRNGQKELHSASEIVNGDVLTLLDQNGNVAGRAQYSDGTGESLPPGGSFKGQIWFEVPAGFGTPAKLLIKRYEGFKQPNFRINLACK
jgi:hypothetical protein